MTLFYDDFITNVFIETSPTVMSSLLDSIAKDANDELILGRTINEIDLRNEIYEKFGISVIEMPECIKKLYNIKGRDKEISWIFSSKKINDKYVVEFVLEVN